MNMNTITIQKLSELMFLIPDAYNKQIMLSKKDPITDGRYFDCDLYDLQSNQKMPDLKKGGYVYWKVMFSDKYEVPFYNEELGGGKIGYIGIPEWLFKNYLAGKSDYIACRQVKLICE